MATERTVATGYLDLHVDDSNLRTEAKTAGTKAGKDFGNSLNQQLRKLNIKEIDLKADPSSALGEIARVRRELALMSANAESIKVKIETESALGDLDKFRKSLGDNLVKVGRESARDYTRAFGSELSRTFSGGVSPQLIAVGVGAATVLAPTVAGILAGAVVGGIGIGGIVGGVALAAKDPMVKEQAQDLAARFMANVGQSAQRNFRGPILAAMGDVRVASEQATGKINQIFENTSPSLRGLVGNVTNAGNAILDSFVYASSKSAGPMAALGRLVENTAGSTAKFIDVLAVHTGAAESSLDDLTSALTHTMDAVTLFFDGLLHVKEAFDAVDNAIDKSRYFLENLTLEMDITADGYKRGTEAAELYRKGLIGVAGSANDYEHYIKAAQQATSLYNGELRITEATEKDVKEQTKELKAAQDALTGSLDRLGGKTALQTQYATALKTAMDNLYGAVIDQTEANESYEASWDSLSEAVAANKTTLDIHTKAGRANRDALEALLQSTNAGYVADIKAGVAIDAATKKHGNRIAAIREESRRLGLNKEETEKLIKTYGRIPEREFTEILIEGVDRVASELHRLYVYQRSLAEGRSIESVEDILRKGSDKGPSKRGGGYAEGGPIIGNGTGTSDNLTIAASPGEYMQRKAAVDYYGVQAMENLNQRKVPREVVRGYAYGGLIAPVNTDTHWPYDVDVSKTYIMSRQMAASKVTPQFGGWPSGPGAQRGDSGIWRKILAMVNASGIPFDFGNAYRPGDPKWHGSGRAIDFMGYGQNRLAKFFLQRQNMILEMIHRTSLRDYAYTRGRNQGSFNEGLMNAHLNHLHIAMDRGGQILPGWNSIYNGTGRPETATPAPMMDAVVQRLDRLISTSGTRMARADINDLAAAIGAVVAGALTGTMPAARAAARQVGKRPR